MGNFSAFFYFYRTVSCVVASVFVVLFIVIVLQWLKIESQQKDIYRLKVEKIDVTSRLKAIEMVRNENHRRANQLRYWE